MGFSGGSEGEESSCSAGDPGLIPESGRSPGEGDGCPLQCSCLENPLRGLQRVGHSRAANTLTDVEPDLQPALLAALLLLLLLS